MNKGFPLFHVTQKGCLGIWTGLKLGNVFSDLSNLHFIASVDRACYGPPN
jgi:hypothetical protein